MGVFDGFRSRSASVAVLPPPPMNVPLPPPPSFGGGAAVVDSGKAAYGVGVGMVLNNPMLEAMRQNPQRFMKQAQVISHSHPWISSAERTVLATFMRTPWHLEDGEENEVTTGAAWDLISRPNGSDPRLLGRRELWRITLRHMGVCANAFWYLDQTEVLAGTPLQILYINPARMWPAEDSRGNLIGWLLDYEDAKGSGTPLPLDNVVHFRLEAPDRGHLGSGGYVESAMSKAELTSMADRYATSLFAGAGVRGGVVGPKEGRLPDDVFDAAVAAFKSIADDPWAARKNVILKGAVDYTPRSMTANEVGLEKLMALGRDDVFAIWGVPPGSRGIPLPAGLNSGETRKYDDAVLWQSGVEDRAVAFVETVQTRVLDRYSDLGQPTTLVIEAPEFDDRTPAFEIASKSVVIAMTNDERRDLVGLPPLDPADHGDLGDQVFIASTMTEVGVPPVQPNITVAPNPVPMIESGLEGPEVGKSRLEAEKGVPSWKAALAVFLRDQRDEIVRMVSERAAHLMRKPTDIEAWWKQGRWDAALLEVNGPRLASTASIAVDTATRRVGPRKAKAGPEDGWQERVARFVASQGGERIVSINGTTRDAVLGVIRDLTKQATDDGWSPGELAARLTDQVEDLSVWSPDRAEMIARTETMLAYNEGSLGSYREFGVAQVEALDGDMDEECANRNGRLFPVDEAFTIVDHPNGTLDWSPVL